MLPLKAVLKTQPTFAACSNKKRVSRQWSTGGKQAKKRGRQPEPFCKKTGLHSISLRKTTSQFCVRTSGYEKTIFAAASNTYGLL